MADALWSNVELLLSFDGADASATITDLSSAARTVTALGNAQLDTARKKYGTAALLLDGAGDAARLESLTDLILSGDFTIECWAYFENATPADYEYLIAAQTDTDPFGIVRDTSGYVHLNMDYSFAISSSAAVTSGAWHHIALERVGSTVTLYIGGVSQGTYTSAVSYDIAELYIGASDYAGTGLNLDGSLDDLRFTVGAYRYGTGFAPPTSALPTDVTATPVTSLIELPAMLGSPAVLSSLVAGQVVESGPLGAPSVLGLHDFSAIIGALITTYVADMVTPGGTVRAPISSWQATIRAGSPSYVQCVIPACTDLVDDITAATEFVIYRRATLASGQVIEYEMARAPATTLAFDQGPTNHTATVSGYADGLPESEDPPAAYDRTLTGIRSQHTGDGGIRIRCAVDWFLRPGQRAYVGTDPFVVGYINYYVPGFDQYMDVGEVNL